MLKLWSARRLELLGGGAGLALGALLGEEDGVDVGEHAAGRDGDGAEQLGELLVVADGELDVAGHDAALLFLGTPRQQKSNFQTKRQGIQGCDTENLQGSSRSQLVKTCTNVRVDRQTQEGHPTLLSRLALPASSRTSAHRYSSTAARYTGAPAPTRVAYLPALR